MTNMREYENEMQKIVYEEFGDELYKKDAEIELKNRETELMDGEQELKNREMELIDRELKSKDNLIKQYREKFKELNKLKDLKPEAKNILSELLLL